VERLRPWQTSTSITGKRSSKDTGKKNFDNLPFRRLTKEQDMKKLFQHLKVALAATFGYSRRPAGVFMGRCYTRDNSMAITFRMRAGFPGEVNRSHPASIEPCLVDAAAPPTAYGQAVLIDPTTQGVRPCVIGDVALTDVWGFTVRPYPFQQASATNYGATNFGDSVPPASGAIDVLKIGYIFTRLGGSAAALKGGAVFVWVAASAGAHVQGQVEAVASAGNTMALDPKRYQFNGPADAGGLVEIIVKD
jgi:hypothetical protein